MVQKETRPSFRLGLRSWIPSGRLAPVGFPDTESLGVGLMYQDVLDDCFYCGVLSKVVSVYDNDVCETVSVCKLCFVDVEVFD